MGYVPTASGYSDPVPSHPEADSYTCRNPECGRAYWDGQGTDDGYCDECGTEFPAIQMRDEWYMACTTPTPSILGPGPYVPFTLRPRMFVAQCEDCGSWMECPPEDAETTDDDGSTWRTASLELNDAETAYVCEGCGRIYPIKNKSGRKVVW